MIIRNRKARHDYEILEQYEAGIALRGAEVKSLREGKASFTDAFARIDRGEAWLHNLHISPYREAQGEALDPTRKRKLLLNRREIRRLASQTAERGLTIVPLDIHFSSRGLAKVTLGLARGKRVRDKREAMRQKTAKREMERALRERGKER